MDGSILIRDLRGQLVLQIVNFNEDAVQIFLVGFQLQKALLALGFPCGVGICKAGNRADKGVVLEIP